MSNPESLFELFRRLPEFLTAKQLANILGISAKTIFGYVRDGKIPYVRIQSNIRFYKWDIFDWLSRLTFSPGD